MYQVQQATTSDFETIKLCIADFSLDDTTIASDQFIVLKENDNLVGFGRIKKHDDCEELSSIGVLNAHRNKGAGSVLVKELIKRCQSKSVYLATVIPDYFTPFGFKKTIEIPDSIREKISICHDVCHAEEVHVMRLP